MLLCQPHDQVWVYMYLMKTVTFKKNWFFYKIHGFTCAIAVEKV